MNGYYLTDYERGFSAMKRIKIEQRNRHLDLTLNHLMSISLDGPRCQEMETHPQEIADKYTKIKTAE
jgi:hypothetical protein